MSVDAKTLAVYNERAKDYATKFDSRGKPGAHLARFIAALPETGHVLDLGCGPGGSAAHMVQAGLQVDAVDASPEMVRLANNVPGLTARIATFDDLNAVAAYDGIWANFSLLHAPRASLPDHLSAIARALRPEGHFHIGMKTGSGTARDHIKRLYTFVTEDELEALLNAAGLDVIARDRGRDVGLAGTDDPWIVLFAKVRDA